MSSATAEAVKGVTHPTDSEMVRHLKQAIPSAQSIHVDLIKDVWIDKATNIREISENYSDEELDAFSQTIRAVGGLLYPLSLIALADSDETDHKKYTLLKGFRRALTLLRMAELGEPQWAQNVPAMVIDEAETVAAQTIIQLIENVARKDLSYLEKAKAIEQAMDDDKTLKQKDIASMLGMTESEVSKLRKLLKLPENIQQMVHNGDISYSHAQTLLYVVPESAWQETAKTAKEMTIGDFNSKMEKLYKAPASSTSDNGSAQAAGDSGSSKATGDQQKRTTTIRATELENTYIPFLKQKVETADKVEKKFTEADMLSARLDTVRAIMLDPNTVLSKEIAPFMAEQAKAEEEAKAHKAENEKREEFFKSLVDDVNEVLKAPVDPLDPTAQRPTLAVAYGSVVQRVMKLTEDEKSKLGFKLDQDVDKLTTELSNAYVEDVKKKREDREKREKQKKEKAQAEAEAKAKAEAAGTAATAS